jgi:hypothetical protein
MWSINELEDEHIEYSLNNLDVIRIVRASRK